MPVIEPSIKSDEIRKLRHLYGDDFYLADSSKFKDNYHELFRTFSEYYENFNIAFSYKTNYLPVFCNIVNNSGGYAELVSEMELELAREYGVKEDKMIWNGPVKSPEIMNDFLCRGGTVNIDNYQEWNNISEIADRNKAKMIKVGIRCNFDVGDKVLSRFGVDVEDDEFDTILRELKMHRNIKLVNLQCHFAKRSASYWPRRTTMMLKLYKKVCDTYSIIPERIDLGGGIYGEMMEGFSRQLGIDKPRLRDYAESSAGLLAAFFENTDCKKPELVIEPGTALVADAMKAVFRVENIRMIRGKWIATVNGSQKNINMQGINPPIQVIHMNESPSSKYEKMDIGGYTCMESDYLYHNYNGKLAVGDYLIFEYCGSYSLVFKSPFIRPDIPVIDIGDGIDHPILLKRRETVKDILNYYQVKEEP